MRKWIAAFSLSFLLGTSEIALGFDDFEEGSRHPASVLPTSTNLNPIYDSSTSKWGFVNDDGKIVLEPAFDDFYGRTTLLDPNVKPEKFFMDGMQAVEIGNQWAFFSYTGLTQIHQGKYADSLSNPSDGLARVFLHGKYGYVDKTGKLLIPAKFEEAGDFFNGLAAVKQDGQWLVINPLGKSVRPWRLGASSPSLWFGPLQISTDEKLSDGMSNFDLRFLLYPENRSTKTLSSIEALVVPESQELTPVKISGSWGYLTNQIPFEEPDLSLLIAPQFEAAGPFSEGLAAVCIHGKWGYIDETGHMVISPNYEQAGIFSKGLAAVKSENKFGYIDKTGRMVISPQYSRAGTFRDKSAAVLLHHVLLYIDSSGKPVFGGFNVPAGDFQADLPTHNLIEISARSARSARRLIPDRVMAAPAPSDQ